MRIDRRDTRCTIVNVNPGTGQPDAPMLTVIGRSRQAQAGVYGTTVIPGPLRVGDQVSVCP